MYFKFLGLTNIAYFAKMTCEGEENTALFCLRDGRDVWLYHRNERE